MSINDCFFEEDALKFENFYTPNRPRRIKFKNELQKFIARVFFEDIKELSTKVFIELPKGTTVLIPGAGANIYLLIALALCNPGKLIFILLDKNREIKIEFYKMLALFASDILFRRAEVKKAAKKNGNPFGEGFNNFVDGIYSHLMSTDGVDVRNFLIKYKAHTLRAEAIFPHRSLVPIMHKFAKYVFGLQDYLSRDALKLRRKNVFDVVYIHTWADEIFKGTELSPTDSVEKITATALKFFKPLAKIAKKYLVVSESDDSQWRMLMLRRYEELGGNANENDGYMRTVNIGIPTLGLQQIKKKSFIGVGNQFLYYTYRKQKISGAARI